VFSPRNPRLLYYANQHLFRTSDGGNHWSKISRDLTRETLTIPPNLDPITAENTAIAGPRRAVIYAIAPSPLRDGLLWVGTDDGLIWITADEGAHWKNVTPADLTPWSKVGIIEASRFDPAVAYAAVDRHRLDDYKPYVYRTSDSGKSWTLITKGIPDGHFVNVVREDPEKKGLLYAGAELGMYVSFDDGDQWQPLQFNLPASSVRDIDVHENDVVIGTHGRAFWILDNVSHLRQINLALESDVVLFKPADAYRLKPAGFTGTPLPKDEPMAANPPDGAVIDYYLKNDMSGPVELDILDRRGNVVRHYSSEEKPVIPDSGRIVVTPDWFPNPRPLSKTTGHHRFVWDVRYAAPEVLKSESKNGDETKGVWVPPDQYSVRLRAGAETRSQPLAILKDPRVKATQPELQSQFELARKVEDERVRLETAAKKVKAVLSQCASLRPKLSPDVAIKVKGLEDALMSLTELSAVPVPWGSPGGAPLKITSLRYLQSAFENLRSAIEDADAAPSPDVISGFEKNRAGLADTLKQLDSLYAAMLPEINQLLKQANLQLLESPTRE
jgi:photosystem II stability/assembly factor-like uncharacterized protein